MLSMMCTAAVYTSSHLVISGSDCFWVLTRQSVYVPSSSFLPEISFFWIFSYNTFFPSNFDLITYIILYVFTHFCFIYNHFQVMWWAQRTKDCTLCFICFAFTWLTKASHDLKMLLFQYSFPFLYQIRRGEHILFCIPVEFIKDWNEFCLYFPCWIPAPLMVIAILFLFLKWSVSLCERVICIFSVGSGCDDEGYIIFPTRTTSHLYSLSKRCDIERYTSSAWFLWWHVNLWG